MIPKLIINVAVPGISNPTFLAMSVNVGASEEHTTRPIENQIAPMISDFGTFP